MRRCVDARRGASKQPALTAKRPGLDRVSARPGSIEKLGLRSLFRWVQRFLPLLIDAAWPCRRAVGDRWFVDETYIKVAGVRRSIYRAVDEDGQVLDI